MGPAATVIAAVAVGVSAVGTVMQMEAAKDAKKAQSQAAEEQSKANAEQKAQNAAQAAAARRQAIREERVKRARVMQAATNTGVSQSSGEMGATGSLSTQLGANLGFNLGANASADRISNYNQNAADLIGSAQNKMADAQMWGSIGSLGTSVFSAAGGFKSVSSIFNSGVPMEQLPALVQNGPTRG